MTTDEESEAGARRAVAESMVGKKLGDAKSATSCGMRPAWTKARATARIEKAEIGSTVARVDRTILGKAVLFLCFAHARPGLNRWIGTDPVRMGHIQLEGDCCGQYRHEMAMNDRSACSLCGSLCDLSLCDQGRQKLSMTA